MGLEEVNTHVYTIRKGMEHIDSLEVHMTEYMHRMTKVMDERAYWKRDTKIILISSPQL